MKKQIGSIKRQRLNFLKNPSLALLCCVCATAIAAGQSVATAASTALLSKAFAQAARVEDSDDRLSNETRQELARARQATLLFHNKEEAEDSQYVDVNLFVSGQGFHAWVWQANPKGIFADNNPNVP